MKKRKKRSWTKEEKVKILREAKEKGVEVTIRKYEVYPSTYYSWRKKYLIGGEDAVDESRLYESILLDLMEASAKKQRSANKPKKIKLTKRQLQELMRRQLK